MALSVPANSPSVPVPPALGSDFSSDGPTISWLTEMVAEGEAFLVSQPGYSDIGRAIEAIMSQDTGPFDPKATLSQTATNRIAKIAEDIAAAMTDTKPFWDYAVQNRRFEQHAANYGKLATFWYQGRNIDLVLADVIKYYVAAGTGYFHLYYDSEIDDMNGASEDPRNVLPIRPSDYKSLESCTGVIIKRKVPVNYIHDRYGYDVAADSDGSHVTWLEKARDVVADVVSPIWKFQKSASSEPALPRIPTVTLYTCYLKDPRRNTSGKAKEMGQFRDEPYTMEIPGDTDPLTGNPLPPTIVDRTRRVADNNWSYTVPPGEPLYPHRRMIVWCGPKILYDGPSFYWHDQFPIIKLTLQPYPWTWLGKAPVWDLLRLQSSLNRLLRIVDDHAAQVAQPGSIHDKNNVSQSSYDSFDTRRAGWKIKQNPLAGKGIQIVNPPPLDQAIWKHIEWIQNEMRELAGITDISRMMQLNQLPSNSTVESILNAMTPALRFRSRIMEAFTRTLAMQLAYNFSQFYTLDMRIVILGPGGIVQDDFDFDPGTLVPDYVHADDFDHMGNMTGPAMLRGPLPRYDRAKEFLRRFAFKITPGSLLNAAQVEQKMIYMQLARAGWMDVYTLWEILGIPNTGVLPANVRTVPERLQWQQSQGLTGDVNAAGRKASGQEIPRLVTKES